MGGLTVRARGFLDCSYEGDLMARAGCSYTVGRESNSVYQETLNGAQVRDKHQFSHPIDPYITPGEPTSGPLPYVESCEAPAVGAGDHRLQAYCFRICMTDDPSLRADWPEPAHYEPTSYELVLRWLHSEKDAYNQTLKADGEFWKFDRLHVPHKTDTNNHGPGSSDLIGANYAWPEASYLHRQRIFQEHLDYQQGLYWLLANDSRVPDAIRRAFAPWGLASDEFTDTGHWPEQLYVREARRLIGAYVHTEHDCLGTRKCEDPIGMGAYTLDSHNCRRFIQDGRVLNEGDVQVKTPAPYGISLRSIVPVREQCRNLLVPVCLSASHIAFGSVRMEPVFMVLGESAAIVADIAIEDDTCVQLIPYATIASALVEADQVLDSDVANTANPNPE